MAITAKVTDASRALHVLEGFFKGIEADKMINTAEIRTLKTWLDAHKSLSYIFPFCDAYEMVERVLEDGIIDKGEQEELLGFCAGFQALGGPVDLLTMEMRNLHGFIHGIVADKKINYEELKALERWMLYHESNAGHWPFDEIYKMIQKILEDGVVTKAEQEEFIKFVKGFIEEDAGTPYRDSSLFVGGWMQTDAPVLKTIYSIVDKNSMINIPGKSFCITGQLKQGKRKDVISILESKGGIASAGVTKSTDYLVIGALSNPCWTYSTYGRKIEKAMTLNKEGGNIVIVHEDDFWKSIEECPVGNNYI